MLRLATKFAPKPQTLEQAYRAGFRNAELWLDQNVLADWKTVLDLTRHYPNSYAMHFPNQLNLPSKSLEETVALYRSLGSRCLVIHQPMFDRYGETLLGLEPTLIPAIENLKLTPQAFNEWAEKNPGLALDVEHLWKFTLKDVPLAQLLEQVRAFLARFADKLRHVHLPGYWPGLAEHRPMYCAREMVFPVLSLLDEAHFEGLVVSEVEMEFQNLLELRMDVLLFDVWRERHESRAFSARTFQ